MEKKKKQEVDLSKIKTVKFNINLSVPKEEFDELLRKMAHMEQHAEQSDQPTRNKSKK